MKAGGTTAKKFTTEFAENAERGKESGVEVERAGDALDRKGGGGPPHSIWILADDRAVVVPSSEAKFKGAQAAVPVPQKSKALR